MKTVSFALALLLVTSAAHAGRLNVPAISGRISNPAGLSPANVRIEARYGCQYSKTRVWGPADTFACGKKIVRATITSASADHRILRFNFPAVTLSGHTSVFRPGTFSGLVMVRVGGREAAASLATFILDERSAVSRFVAELRELSLVYFAPARLRFVDQRGASAAASIARTFGEDAFMVSVASSLSTEYENERVPTRVDTLAAAQIRGFFQVQPGVPSAVSFERAVRVRGKDLSRVKISKRFWDLRGTYPTALTDIIVDGRWAP